MCNYVLQTLILVGTSRPHKDKAKNTNFLVGTDCGDLFLTHTFSESWAQADSFGTPLKNVPTWSYVSPKSSQGPHWIFNFLNITQPIMKKCGPKSPQGVFCPKHLCIYIIHVGTWTCTCPNGTHQVPSSHVHSETSPLLGPVRSHQTVLNLNRPEAT